MTSLPDTSAQVTDIDILRLGESTDEKVIVGLSKDCSPVADAPYVGSYRTFRLYLKMSLMRSFAGGCLDP